MSYTLLFKIKKSPSRKISNSEIHIHIINEYTEDHEISSLGKSNIINHVFVQRLRSKPWTYMAKFFVFFYLFFCHSVSNFLGIQLANALVSGCGSNTPLIQEFGPSNSRARLRHATRRFFSGAEQCHTQKFYLRCFKLDFDAVKSKFGLLIEQIEEMTSKWSRPQKWRQPQK